MPVYPRMWTDPVEKNGLSLPAWVISPAGAAWYHPGQ